MKKTTKILAVLSAYFFLLIIDGCVNCNCPEITLKYFDYRKIEIAVDDKTLDPNDNLSFQFTLDSIYFLAENNLPCWNLGLINTAAACSCNEPGDSGWKFPIQQIDIFSNKDFNSSLPANSSLNSIMTVYSSNQTTLLVEATQEIFIELQWESSNLSIFTSQRPDNLNEPHIFTIHFTKSNGEIISSQTPPITWN